MADDDTKDDAPEESEDEKPEGAEGETPGDAGEADSKPAKGIRAMLTISRTLPITGAAARCLVGCRVALASTGARASPTDRRPRRLFHLCRAPRLPGPHQFLATPPAPWTGRPCRSC